MRGGAVVSGDASLWLVTLYTGFQIVLFTCAEPSIGRWGPPQPRELPTHYSPICQSGWRPPQTAGLLAGSWSLAYL